MQVHFTIRIRAQSGRRQHEKKTSEKIEMVTYKDTTQVGKICVFDLSEVNH